MPLVDKLRIVGIVILLAGAGLFPVLSDNPKRYLSFVAVLGTWHGASWFALTLIAAGAFLVIVSFFLRRE